MKKLILLILIITNIFSAQKTISKRVYKQLQKAQKLIEKKEYIRAKNILDPIVKDRENIMEKTYALQSLANIYINQNKYKKVIGYYEQIIDLNSLEKKDIDNIKFTLSKIHLSQANYKKSIKYSKELLLSPHIKKNSLIENLALAYYYDTRYKQSSSYIKQVIKVKKDKEQWYRMLYSSYIEIKNYPDAIKTLKYMIGQYNQEEYWMQLISIYQTTKKHKKTLATLELAYKKKAINQKKNLMYLVNILFQHNLYNKAALLMDDSIKRDLLVLNEKNFNLMISAYLNAKNYKKAIPKLSTSKFSKTDKYKLILGNIHFNNSRYKEAINTLSKFKFTKNSKIDGKRNTLTALCFYELDNTKESKKYLKKAIKNKFEKKRATNLAKDLGYKI